MVNWRERGFTRLATTLMRILVIALAGGLAFDLEAGRTMEQHHAGGHLVNVLSAMSAGTDEGFFDVGFADSQSSHALCKLCFFVARNLEGAHGARVTARREHCNRIEIRVHYCDNPFCAQGFALFKVRPGNGFLGSTGPLRTKSGACG